MKKTTETRKEGTQKMSLELEGLTERIISRAIEVHKNLGQGFLKSIYQTALPMELIKQNLKVETQKALTVFYDGKEIGLHRLDLAVEGQIIVGLKAVKEFDNSHTVSINILFESLWIFAFLWLRM